MTLSPTVKPRGPSPKLVTLTVELSNTRMDRGQRLRNRTERYAVGLAHGGDAGSFTPPYDLFSFCCYRALLLGSPAVVIRATVQPPRRGLLKEPLPPQRLRGEDTVERMRGTTTAMLYVQETRQGKYSLRRFFGFRTSDSRREGRREWLHYRPDEVILDPATGAPPTFTDVADFERKSQLIAHGGPLTRAQAWSTWLWLVLHKTFYAAKLTVAGETSPGQVSLQCWEAIMLRKVL